MQARRAQAVAEEFETMRAIAKKEREVAKKLEAVRLETEARIAREAAIRDAERKARSRRNPKSPHPQRNRGKGETGAISDLQLSWRRWRR